LYKILSFLLLLCLLQTTSATISSQIIPPADNGNVGTFEPAPCPIAVPDGLVEGQTMICGYVTVPEQHADPNGHKLRLAVARFPSLSKTPAPDPVVLLAGGPGESNFLAYIPGMAGPGGQQFLAKRDAVVIELRGLLYSEPNLLCPERFDVQERQTSVTLNSDEAIAEDLRAVQACHDRLASQGINLAAFNNQESAVDIAMVMTALGYDTFNLYGNSAGTLLAQHVMKDYPQRLRTVTMGSVVPLAATAWPAMPANASRALQRLFETCAADAACRRAYPHLETVFLSAVDRLNQEPVIVRLTNPTTQEPFDLLLTGDRFAQLIYSLLLMDANSGPSIPYLIDRVAAGNYEPLQTVAGFFLPSRSFSQGLQYSTICAEEANFASDDVALGGSYPAFAKAVSTIWFGPERLLSACKIWNVPYLGDAVHEPSTSNVPTLLLAGDFDPNCPPSYAQTVARSLSKAYTATFPVGHGPIDGGPCPLSMAVAFLDDPAKAPGSTCISAMRVSFVSEPIADRLLSPSVPHLILLLVCLLVMLSAPLVWAVAARRKRQQPGQIPVRARLARRLVGLACGLNVLFFLLVILQDPTHLVFGYPLGVRLGMALPLLSFIPLAGGLLLTVLAWRERRAFGARLYDMAVVLALLGFLWELNYWHLLGWHW
jgi:pimeloyl-ACP methyl ester carboxylesterase